MSVNYPDIFAHKAQEIDLIQEKVIPAASTGTIVLSYKIPQFYTGYTTAFLIRELDANYNDFAFEIRINKINVFTQWGFDPGFIPLLPDFTEFMRRLDKGDLLDLVVDNTGAERTILGWIKIIWSKGWKV